MNYRHAYHAGGFADVFKHVVLVAILEALSKKDKPWCYIDTHAGAGEYHLLSTSTQKTREYDNGIAKIALASAEEMYLPPVIQRYLDIVMKRGFPKLYPGSPLIARACARPEDRLILLELHPEEVENLQICFKGDKQSKIYHQDGFALKGFLPPLARRGLVFIDPPFEKTEDWQSIIDALKISLMRFATGIYAVWYPIKDNQAVNDFHEKLKGLDCKEVLTLALSIYPEDSPLGLKACGMTIINPPWQLDATLREATECLKSLLTLKC